MLLEALGRRPAPLWRSRGGEPAIPVHKALGGSAGDVGAGGDEVRLLRGEGLELRLELL